LNNIGLNWTVPLICGSFKIVNTTIIYDLQLVESVNVELQMPRKHRYGMIEYRRSCVHKRLTVVTCRMLTVHKRLYTKGCCVHKRLTISYMQNADCYMQNVEGLGP